MQATALKMLCKSYEICQSCTLQQLQNVSPVGKRDDHKISACCNHLGETLIVLVMQKYLESTTAPSKLLHLLVQLYSSIFYWFPHCFFLEWVVLDYSVFPGPLPLLLLYQFLFLETIYWQMFCKTGHLISVNFHHEQIFVLYWHYSSWGHFNFISKTLSKCNTSVTLLWKLKNDFVLNSWDEVYVLFFQCLGKKWYLFRRPFKSSLMRQLRRQKSSKLLWVSLSLFLFFFLPSFFLNPPRLSFLHYLRCLTC